MGVALFIGICAYFTNNPLFYLLYAALPIIIYFADRYAKRNQPKVPASFVSRMVDKTWTTFGIFAIAFFVFSFFYDIAVFHYQYKTSTWFEWKRSMFMHV